MDELSQAVDLMQRLFLTGLRSWSGRKKTKQRRQLIIDPHLPY
jgi:hypothetical protein